MMQQKVVLVLLSFFLFSVSVSAQSFSRLMRQANKNYEIHNYNLAIDGYLQALQKRQSDAEALSKLANSYRMLNRLEESASFFQQMRATNNYDVGWLLSYGQTLKGLGQYDRAKAIFKEFADRGGERSVATHFMNSCDFAVSQLSNAGTYQVNSELINTPFSDFAPTFAGQQQVVYSSARTDLGTEQFNGRAVNNLLVSNLSNGNLGVPYLLRTGYTAENNLGVGPVAYSPDGTMVAFTRNNFVNGRRQIPQAGMEVRLFMAQVNPSGQWVDIRPFQYNGANFNTGFAAFSPDGQSLYFASDRQDSFGGYDIYICSRVGNSWSTPQNLGPVINSPGNELTPYYDGQNLYFASDYHAGFGGLDNFRAEQDNRGQWTQIYHMGALINSNRDDYGYVYDNQRNLGYLVSNRQSSSGNEDIFSVRRAANNIVLRIVNAADGTPVPNAVVDFVDCGEGAYPADLRGEYSFQAMQGLNCNLVIRKDGYFSVTLPVSATGNNDNQDYTINLNKVTESYNGTIVDYTRRTPIPNAMVRITNRSTGSSVESVTDVNGDYFVALSPYTTYDLTIEAPGYQSYQFALPVEGGQNPDLLGVISMLPIGTSTGGTTYPNQPAPGTNPGTGTAPTTPTGPVGNGYAVQVAANNTPALEKFANVQDLGNLYSVQQGNLHKIRVGVFDTRAAADRALAAAKQRGYSGAFIVREEGAPTGITDTRPNPNTTSPVPNTTKGGFRVQLAAYRNPQYFDDSRVRSLGTIDSMPKGDLTVMLIRDIFTIEDARRVRQQARSAGFAGAFILAQNADGTYKKVD